MADDQQPAIDGDVDESRRFAPADRKRWITVHHPDLQADGVNSRIHAAAWPLHAAGGFVLVDDDPDGDATVSGTNPVQDVGPGPAVAAGPRRAPSARTANVPADPPAGQ